MKNTFGQSVSVTLFGESHGEAIGAVLDGIAPGIKIDEARIADSLARRRPSSSIDTARRESDRYSIISGVFNGCTTGTPIAVIIPNEDKKSTDYSQFRTVARPSHADYAAQLKYHGYQDYRGGGHFSGRVTAALVAVGAIAATALELKGIKIATHIKTCGTVCDRGFEDVAKDIEALSKSAFPVLSDCEEAMRTVIEKAKSNLDSVGGVTETVILGMPGGVGEPWFDSVESVLSHAIFSLGGIKGIEFGDGFGLASMFGSEANDAFAVKDGEIVTETNRNGGINGGITNGMPILFRCAVKPTPSISAKQKTVDFAEKKETELEIKGRHDPAIIRRICPVIDSVCALAVCDMLASRFGTDYFTKKDI